MLILMFWSVLIFSSVRTKWKRQSTVGLELLAEAGRMFLPTHYLYPPAPPTLDVYLYRSHAHHHLAPPLMPHILTHTELHPHWYLLTGRTGGTGSYRTTNKEQLINIWRKINFLLWAEKVLKTSFLLRLRFWFCVRFGDMVLELKLVLTLLQPQNIMWAIIRRQSDHQTSRFWSTNLFDYIRFQVFTFSINMKTMFVTCFCVFDGLSLKLSLLNTK